MEVNYLEYCKYILEHKKNVFKTCWKRGLYIHAFTHDLSKFSPREFIPYAKWFYGEYGVNIDKSIMTVPNIKVKHRECRNQFDQAWENHYRRNKHHWDYWIGKRMPSKYIIQMICDWEAMSIKFGDTAQEFYMNNYDKIKLTVESRCELEFRLDLIPSELLCSNVTWKQACKSWNVSMKEDLTRCGYIK